MKTLSEIGSLASRFKHALILSLDYIMKLLCETCFFVMKTTLKMFNNHILLLVLRLLGRSLLCFSESTVGTVLSRWRNQDMQHLSSFGGTAHMKHMC